MTWPLNNRRRLLQQLWACLGRAPKQLNHPFRTPALATAGAGSARLRTVILREVDPAQRLLVCHTDRRSAKVRDLQRRPRLEWLFYDPDDQVQIRASGPAQLRHGTEACRRVWDQIPLPSRMNYLARQAPGTVIRHPDQAWPLPVRRRQLDRQSTEPGFRHFAILHSCIDHLEFLQLDGSGHRRVLYRWGPSGWSSRWITP